MSVDFKQMLTELRSLVASLKDRCSTAEAKNVELAFLAEQQKVRIEELEKMNEELRMNYRNLQVALSKDCTPEEIELHKNRFLSMVREVDDCIARLSN